MIVTPFLVVPLITWAIAQTIKFILALFRGDFDVRYLIASGGMPSVHSAVVCSLVVIALAEGGVASPLFGITGVLAAIVMYDSFGVRRSAGEQAKTLNKLIEDLSSIGDIRHPEDYGPLREILGHRPVEVSVGALLGILIALLFEADKLNSHLSFLISPASRVESIVFIVLGAVLLISGVFAFIKLDKKARQHKIVRSYRLQLLFCSLSGSALILILALGQLQSASYLVARVFPYVVATIWGIWLSIIISRLSAAITVSQNDQAKTVRRDKWLKKAGKKKKKK